VTLNGNQIAKKTISLSKQNEEVNCDQLGISING